MAFLFSEVGLTSHDQSLFLDRTQNKDVFTDLLEIGLIGCCVYNVGSKIQYLQQKEERKMQRMHTYSSFGNNVVNSSQNSCYRCGSQSGNNLTIKKNGRVN